VFTWSDGAVLGVLWWFGALECLGWVTPLPPVGWVLASRGPPYNGGLLGFLWLAPWFSAILV